MKNSTTTTILLLILGVPLFIFGIRELFQVKDFVAGSEETEGIVIEMREGPSKYYPRVRFQTKSGETIEFSSGNGSNPPLYKVNETVPVLYSDANPQYAVINSFIEIWLGPVIYAGLGLFFLISFVFQKVKSKS